jgi:hypothetical protein
MKVLVGCLSSAHLQHVQWLVLRFLAGIYWFLKWSECASDRLPLLALLNDLNSPLSSWEFQTLSPPPPFPPRNRRFMTFPPGSLWYLSWISSHFPPGNMKVQLYPPSSLQDLFLISLYFTPQNLNLHLCPPDSLWDPWLVSSHFPPRNLHYHLYPPRILWDLQLISLPHHWVSFQPLAHKHKPFTHLWHWGFHHASATSSILGATS